MHKKWRKYGKCKVVWAYFVKAYIICFVVHKSVGGLQYTQYERKYRKQREVTNNTERIIYIHRYVWDQSKRSQKCRNVKHTNSRPLVLSKLLWKVGINSALSQRLLLEVKINSTWVPSSHPLQQLIAFTTFYVTSIQRSPCLPSYE